MTTSVLSPEELFEVTGYRQPARQLRELHKQGYYRARLAKVTGTVILERPHYDAVAGGALPANQEQYRPQVKPPRLRRVQ